MSRVLLTRRWPEPAMAKLREHYEVTVDTLDRPLKTEALALAMQCFDAICPTVSDRLGADVLLVPGRKTRILANYGTGIEHIDLAAARSAGIVVTNTPDVLTDATAELAIVLMLMASRRVSEGERELRRGAWTGWRPTHLIGSSVSGKLLGLVGFGRIAQAVARLAHAAFGMRIAYYARQPAPPRIGRELTARYVPSLEALATEVDVLSLHCPGGELTRHLVNAGLLAKMKRSAILVNTARGSVIDEAALTNALKCGQIAAAALDVYEREPAISPALLELPNAVLLPHLGSATEEARTAMGRRAILNLDCYLAGEEPPDRVC